MPPYFEALLHLGLGERDEALARLEAAFASKESMMRDIGVDPPWWELRAEPRYRALVVGLVLDPVTR